MVVFADAAKNTQWLDAQSRRWRHIKDSDDDKALTDWLIEVFGACFAACHTVLVRGGEEPEYRPKTDADPAQIIFARGFFSSALHEISHWCIAGAQRRALVDFGYWYYPDGRNQALQEAFERVEIRPQAIECLFTLALGKRFFVSADNLNADFDPKNGDFAKKVHTKAAEYLEFPYTLPKDAQRFLRLLLALRCHSEKTLFSDDNQRNKV